MREILFRGIAKSHGTFEFGDLITSMGKTYIGNTIGNHPDDWCEVIPETVGQFTGLTDKNGVKIFEGDIDKNGGIVEFFYSLNWDSGGSVHSGFYCEKWFESDQELSFHYGFDEFEVTGNIHDNPKLL